MLFLISSWFTIITNSILGVIVWKKNPRGVHNRFFAATTASIVGWIITLFFYYVLTDPLTVLILGRLNFAVAGFIGYFFYRFVSVFPAEDVKFPRWLYVTLAVSEAIVGFLTVFTSLVDENELIQGEERIVVYGPLYAVWALLLLLTTLIGVVLLAIKLRRARGRTKAQLQYLVLGFVVLFVVGFSTNIVMPYVFNNYVLQPFGPVASIAFVGAITYAILRERFLDIQLIIRRGAVFTLLFTLIFIMYSVMIDGFSSILPHTVSRVMTIAIITLTFAPLKQLLERWTDSVFFRKQYRFEDAVRTLNHIMVETANLDQLLLALKQHLSQLLKIEKISIVLLEPKGEFVNRLSSLSGDPLKLQRHHPLVDYFTSQAHDQIDHIRDILVKEELQHEISSSVLSPGARDQKMTLLSGLEDIGFAVAVPFYYQKNLIGLALLGNKLSGDSFKETDLQFLSVVSHETASSIENAASFEHLKRMDEIKSELIAVASHQLRTPVTVSRWNLELVTQGDFGQIPESAVKVLNSTYEAMIVLSDGLNNLMIVLEIEEGKLMMSYEKIQLVRDILDPVLALYSRELARKRIHVEKDMSPDDEVEVDKLKVRKVLEVLLDNAIRYAPDDSRVVVHMHDVHDSQNREVTLSVEDEGVGVDVDYRNLIFQRFYRGEKAKHVSPDGFGLGLFIARAYVEAHGGRLWYEKKSTPGSMFLFRIPKRARLLTIESKTSTS